MKRGVAVVGVSLLGYACLLSYAAQQHNAPAQMEHGQPPQRLVAYPDRPKAPQAVIDHGKAIYGANCAFCHGSDAAGGAVGPNLLRSSVVLGDQNGELLAPIVHGGRKDKGMPAIPIDDAMIGDVAAWLHSIHITSGTYSHEDINIVVGNAKTGAATFHTLCGSCHSVTKDLKGYATRFTDPKVLQQSWLMPSTNPKVAGGTAVSVIPAATATVNLADGQKVDGTLIRVDDFSIDLALADGSRKSFVLDNGVPKVDLHDPLEPHRALLPKYSDKEIHDITAYLVTIK